jgi:hypothetical protein
MIPYLASRMFRRDSVQANHRLPGKVFTCKTTLGWGRTRPDSMIVITKGGYSYCFRGSRVSCCQLFSLARWLLIQISMTPRIWMKLVLWASNVDMRRCVYLIWEFLDDDDYFVVMAWCYIIYCMSYLCMLSIGVTPHISKPHDYVNHMFNRP